MKKIKYKSFLNFLRGFVVILSVTFFCNYSYYSGDKSLNPIQIIGGYIDDNLLYKYAYGLDGIDEDGSKKGQHDNEVVIVKIDEKTLNAFQSSNDIRMLSFTKSIYADVIENLINKYQARVIGIDIVFSNKSNLGEEDEDILKTVLEKYSDRVVIGTRSDGKEKPLCKYNNVSHGSVEAIIEQRIRAIKIWSPFYKPDEGCLGEQVYHDNQDGIHPLSVEVLKKFYNNGTKSELRNSILVNQLRNQSIENDGNLFINFTTNKENNIGTLGYKSYSLIDVFNKKDTTDSGEYIILKDKIVLIGEVGSLLHDKHFSPVNFKTKMPGVEFHANSIQTMYYNEYLLLVKQYIIIMVLVLTLVILFVVIEETKTIVNIIVSVIIIIFHYYLGRELFLSGYIYPLGFFIYSIILSFIVFYVFKFILTERHRKFIKKAFSMYISPEMVDMISADPTKLDLKGNKSDITVYFSDIANFTRLSEKMDTEHLFEYLNEYFTEMTEILTNNSGTLDKYIGDAIMGFFNAPIKVIDHAFLACKTALEQQNKMIELNEKWTAEKKPCIEIRIGINSGEMMHGNIGSLWKNHERINYTVMGDQVNLASRLESVNKVYGTSIIISEGTQKEVMKQFLVRELDNIKVKGKEIQTKIYELIGYNDDYEVKPEYIVNYELGLHSYYKEMYSQAIVYFKKNPNDAASKVMIERCRKVKEGEISVTGGVYEMDSK